MSDNVNDMNSGNRNSGDRNSGDGNSGSWNSGDGNSGSWNSGSWNSGAFNRDEPKMRLFEKELDMTVSQFYNEYNLYVEIPLNEWVYERDMTDDEKGANPKYKTNGGYLKTLDYKEACVKWWEQNPDEHERFLTLPNFDAQIFYDITGIDVRDSEAPQKQEDEYITINGVKYKKVDTE